MKKTLLITTILASMAAAPVAYAGGESAEWQAGYDAAMAEMKSRGGSNKSLTNSKAPGPLGGIADALRAGNAYSDIRFRYEAVDDDGAAFTSGNAEAATVRTRLGYKTAVYENFQGLLELENVSQLAGIDDHNDGSNGKTTFPTIADPEGTEINQAWISFAGVPDNVIKAGRQRIVLDNARFIGDVGWRQNNQTFDGVRLTDKLLPDTTINYSYLYNVNRIFGNSAAAGDFNGKINLVNIKYTGLDLANVTAYWYGIDLNNSAANSSATYGARIDGKYDVGNGVKALYDLEYALQSDYGNNTNNYDANYYRVEPGVAWNGLTLKGGYEVLGADVAGDAGRVFRTPLATGHKWNGWADKFLTTPKNGLQDIYGSLGYKVGGLNEFIDGTALTFVYHDFSSDENSTDYGNEFDFNIAKTFYDNYSLGFKYANYDSDDEAAGIAGIQDDTQKFIVSVGVKFNQE